MDKESPEVVWKRVAEYQWQLVIDGTPAGDPVDYETIKPYLLGRRDWRELLTPAEPADGSIST